jgi:hypothetical protein
MNVREIKMALKTKIDLGHSYDATTGITVEYWKITDYVVNVSSCKVVMEAWRDEDARKVELLSGVRQMILNVQLGVVTISELNAESGDIVGVLYNKLKSYVADYDLENDYDAINSSFIPFIAAFKVATDC